MGGLDDDEAVGCPECCEWAVAIEGGEVIGTTVAVGEEDDWEVTAGGWGRDFEV